MATVAALGRPLASRVSWGALFAGFFFGFGIWTILLALGAGIGLASFDPQDIYGLLTLAAAILGGRQGIPRDRAIIREEPAPVPGAPFTPQRA
jgi:hypothetical protein